MTHSQNSKMQKGSGIYTCEECGKNTRETGNGESFVRFCRKCYEIGGLENSLSDGTITQDEFDTYVASL